MDLGSVAPLTGAEWIGQPQHEALQRGIRPQIPADDPFTTHLQVSSIPTRARCSAAATLSWRFSG